MSIPIPKNVGYFIGLISLALAGSSFAQTVDVSGYVYNVSQKPIPNAKVTATGKETVPGISDATGLYVMKLRAAPGQAIKFHVEQDSYSALDLTVAVAPPIPINFVMRPNKTVPPTKVLTSLHNGLKAVDRPYRELDCAKPPCATSYNRFPIDARLRMDPSGSPSSIEFVNQSPGTGTQESVFGSISLADIAKLNDEQKILIVVYEEAVTKNYGLWASLSSQLQTQSLSTQEKNALAGRLVLTGRDMCGNFDNLLGVLHEINLRVWDHYWGIKYVCDRYRQSQIASAGGYQ